MKCPKCGYDNKEHASACGLCKEVFIKSYYEESPDKDALDEKKKQNARKKGSLIKIRLILLVLSFTPFIKGCDQGIVFGFPFSFSSLPIRIDLKDISLLLINIVMLYLSSIYLKKRSDKEHNYNKYLIGALTCNLCLFWMILLSNNRLGEWFVVLYLLIPAEFINGIILLKGTDIEIGSKSWFILSTVIWIGLFKFKDSKFNIKFGRKGA